MPRTCTICTHPQRAAIEAACIASTPYRDIARQFRVSKDAVARHGAEHLPAAISHAQEAREAAQALDVVRQLKAINAATVAILAETRRTREHDIALRAIDRIQRQLELQAKLLGDLDERPQINIMLSTEWLTVRGALMDALLPYADARAAAASALLKVEAQQHAAQQVQHGGNHGRLPGHGV
jgi:hypothetical protein